MTTPDPTVRPVPPTGAPSTGASPSGPPTAGAPATPADPPPAAPPRRPGRRRARGIGLTAAAALLVAVTVLLVLFVVFNTQTVRVSLVFGDVEAPLVVALLAAAVLGGLIVGLASLVRRGRRSNR